jgi:hypothetical protein
MNEIDVNVVVIIGTPLPNSLPKIRPLKNPNNGKSKMVSNIFENIKINRR